MHLTPTEITFLADSFAKTNPMSPFVNNKKELTGTEAQTLEEKGIFSQEVAESFRENILSRGGSEHPKVLYRRFRGQDATIDALMKRDGIK